MLQEIIVASKLLSTYFTCERLLVRVDRSVVTFQILLASEAVFEIYAYYFAALSFFTLIQPIPKLVKTETAPAAAAKYYIKVSIISVF